MRPCVREDLACTGRDAPLDGKHYVCNDCADVWEQEALAATKLAEQWPKRCGCGKVYPTTAAWELLPFAYNYTDAFATQEARHCPCGSTLAINAVIHDLSKE